MTTTNKTNKVPSHPDTISGLSAQCRSVLRADYQVIQVRSDRLTTLRKACAGTGKYMGETITERDVESARTELDAAIREYQHTASLWGVEV